MKTVKLTPGEQLYAASNNADFWAFLAEKKEREAAEKADRKRIAHEKFQAAKLKHNVQPKEEAVIAEDAPKYRHGRFGIGSLVCEDDTTITLSFDGEVKKMVKAYTILTLV